MVANKEAFDHQLNFIEGGFEWYKLRHFESGEKGDIAPTKIHLIQIL